MPHCLLTPPIQTQSVVDISFSDTLGEGANAKIYLVKISGHYYAAKIYTDNQALEAQKLAYMIKNAPSDLIGNVGGKEYPRYAWPISIIKNLEFGRSGCDVGFLMPFIDKRLAKTLDYFFDFHLSKSLSANTSNVLSFKIEILRNLAALISGLHNNGHKFIDLKPQNIAVYEGTNIVTLLDCDGFSIYDATRGSNFQSRMVSPDYIAPEIYKVGIANAVIDKNQDEYAFAVIAFQMLNNGIHPFQGILVDKNLDISQNDEAASYGLYPYGIIPSSRILPKPQSIHETYLDETRVLFDRAFSSAIRPNMMEWYNHFDSILSTTKLIRCSQAPSDPSHIHFRGKSCPLCQSETIKIKPISIVSTIKSFSDIAADYAEPPTATANKSSLKNWMSLAAICICAWVFVKLLQATVDQSSSVSNTTETKQPGFSQSQQNNSLRQDPSYAGPSAPSLTSPQRTVPSQTLRGESSVVRPYNSEEFLLTARSFKIGWSANYDRRFLYEHQPDARGESGFTYEANFRSLDSTKNANDFVIFVLTRANVNRSRDCPFISPMQYFDTILRRSRNYVGATVIRDNSDFEWISVDSFGFGSGAQYQPVNVKDYVLMSKKDRDFVIHVGGRFRDKADLFHIEAFFGQMAFPLSVREFNFNCQN